MANEVINDCPQYNEDFKSLVFWKHSGFTEYGEYPADCTRNCSLHGTDIDRNFYNIKADMIRNVWLSGNTIYMERWKEGIFSGVTAPQFSIDLSKFADSAYTVQLISSALTDYYKKAEVYTKSETDRKITEIVVSGQTKQYILQCIAEYVDPQFVVVNSAITSAFTAIDLDRIEIVELGKQIDSANTIIEKHEENFDSAFTAININKEQINSAFTDISFVNTKVDSAYTEIDKTNINVQSAFTEINNINKKVASAYTRMEELKQEIDSAYTEINLLWQEISGLLGKIQGKDNQIKVTINENSGATIGFADNAIFAADNK